MFHSSPQASSSGKTKAESSGKTLTPQRKHRKLTKDGSSEVWPESIEQIFVQGLKAYWESPWATYSRGRSRWRNQFLVDHLQKAGITRTKKQVASHIQVLRNMWKGEAEYHLVAGGDELFLETGQLIPVKSEENDGNALIPMDREDSDGMSPISPSTSGYATSDYSDAPMPTTAKSLSPIYRGASYFGKTPLSKTGARRTRSNSPAKLEITGRIRRSSPLSPGGSSPSSSPLPRSSFESHSSNFRAAPPKSASLPTGRLDPHSHFPGSFASSSAPASPAAEPFKFGGGMSTNHVGPFDRVLAYPSHGFQSQSLYPAHNGMSSLTLWAEGMLPLTVPVDTLSPAHQPPPSNPAMPSIVLRVKLQIASIDTLNGPSSLHGFAGTASFTHPWTSSAQCITKVFEGTMQISEETGPLQLMMANPREHSQSFTAFLPESALSRCRWLDTNVQMNLSQQIVVDGVTLAIIIYELDRSPVGGMPSAELIEFQCNPVHDLPPATYHTSVSPNSSYVASYTATPQSQFLSTPRQLEQSSFSCSLPDTDSLRPRFMTPSLSF